MPHILRDYQQRAVGACLRHINLRPINVLPTAGGKTVVAVEVVRRLGVRALFVAHTREIVGQAVLAFRSAGLRTGLILSGEVPDTRAQVQVASIQTLARRSLPDCEIAVVDECHHATQPSYARVLAHYGRVMGLTATPARLDGRGLGEAGFGVFIEKATTAQLCARGFLHAPRVYAAPRPNLQGVRTVRGDYEGRSLSVRMTTPRLIGNVVTTWLRRAEGRRTVVFAVGIEHARSIEERFSAAGVRAETVTGATPKAERDAMIRRLGDGETRVLCNVGVLTEGWDLPPLECVIAARPTQSYVLFRQAVGRVMRACPGKTGALLLDHAGWTSAHGLVTDSVRWTLTGYARRRRRTPTRVCSNCGLVVPRTLTICPGCRGVVLRTRAPRDMMPMEAPGELRLDRRAEREHAIQRAILDIERRRRRLFRALARLRDRNPPTGSEAAAP